LRVTFVMRENVASGFVLGSARGLAVANSSFDSRRKLPGYSQKKFVSASRQNQHASRVRSPDPNGKIFFAAQHFPSIFRAHRIRRVRVYYAAGADFFVARDINFRAALCLEKCPRLISLFEKDAERCR